MQINLSNFRIFRRNFVITSGATFLILFATTLVTYFIRTQWILQRRTSMVSKYDDLSNLLIF